MKKTLFTFITLAMVFCTTCFVNANDDLTEVADLTLEKGGLGAWRDLAFDNRDTSPTFYTLIVEHNGNQPIHYGLSQEIGQDKWECLTEGIARTSKTTIRNLEFLETDPYVKYQINLHPVNDDESAKETTKATLYLQKDKITESAIK